MRSSVRNILLLVIGTILAPGAHAAATISIVNNDAPNVGFNDTTAADPVGGNSGTMLGSQRMIAFQTAANKWGATLTSAVNIRIRAQWTALTCADATGVLGLTNSTAVFSDFPGAPKPGHWYPKALANELSGVDHDSANPDIETSLNINLGQSGCLTGTFFYLGLDNNHGPNIDLVTVLTHELAHGLGFLTFTDASTGVQCCGSTPQPSAYDDFLFDTTTSKNWTAMSDSERVASALNTQKLVWTGANVVSAVPVVLHQGLPFLTVTAPASTASKYIVGTATFGPSLGSPGVTGQVAQLVDSSGNLGLACTALSPDNAAAVAGKIALIDRGICTFVTKAENAQAAGAIGVVIADNVSGSPPDGMSGTDPSVTIPCVRITMADGASLKISLAVLPSDQVIMANIGVDLTYRAGADPGNRPFMHTPNPFQDQSSVTHWDTSAFPNQLMEPNITDDLTHEVLPPYDLTAQLLKDIGWSYAAPTPTIPVIEYYYPPFNAYFVTSVPNEIAVLDAGALPGWVRTGYQFNAYDRADAPPTSNSVCRFFNVSFAPKSAHFYALHGLGCEQTLAAFPDWKLESPNAFNMLVPLFDGSCPVGSIPVYRFYNNGMGGAPNHRFTTNATVRKQMIALGWTPEPAGIGVGFCSPQ